MDRDAARACPVPLRLHFDAAADDAERNAFERPAAHEIKTHADNPHEMPVIRARETRFDLTAEFADVDGARFRGTR